MNKVAIGVVVLLAVIGLSGYAYTVYMPGLSSSSNGSPTGSSSGSTAGPGSAGTGTMNIYLADPPPQNQTLKYLLINVTSITLKYSSNVTAVSTTTATTSSSTSTTSAGSSASSSTSSTTGAGSAGGFSNRFVFNVSSSRGTDVNLTKLQGPGILLGSTKVPAGNVTGIILQVTGAEAFWTNGSHTQLMVVANGKLMINIHFTIQSNGTANLTLNLVPGDIHVSPGQASVLRPVVMASVVSSGPQGTQTVTTSETETESTTTSSSSPA